MSRATLIRRVLGVLFLVTAGGMLVAGETLLKGRLDPFATLCYWSVCLLATCGAIVCALTEALRALHQSRKERRTLLEETLREIDAERARRQKRAGNPPPESR